MTRRRHEGRADAVSGDVRERERHASIGKVLPPEVIAAGLVRRLIPAGHVVAGEPRRLLRQQPLLDGARGFELAPYPLHLARFAQRGAHVTSYLTRHLAGDQSCHQDDDDVADVELDRIQARPQVRRRIVGEHVDRDGRIAAGRAQAREACQGRTQPQRRERDEEKVGQDDWRHQGGVRAGHAHGDEHAEADGRKERLDDDVADPTGRVPVPFRPSRRGSRAGGSPLRRRSSRRKRMRRSPDPARRRCPRGRAFGPR